MLHAGRLAFPSCKFLLIIHCVFLLIPSRVPSILTLPRILESRKYHACSSKCVILSVIEQSRVLSPAISAHEVALTTSSQLEHHELAAFHELPKSKPRLLSILNSGTALSLVAVARCLGATHCAARVSYACTAALQLLANGDFFAPILPTPATRTTMILSSTMISNGSVTHLQACSMPHALRVTHR
eukprot:5886550-Pleurochrysis_carterae.AAC.3